MREFRLNGWQRIGIVLSVLWAIVGAIWGLKIAAAPYDACMSNPALDWKYCEVAYGSNLTPGYQIGWAVAVGLLPISLAWLLIYVIWTVRGFKPYE
jgi:hypothetical protein